MGATSAPPSDLAFLRSGSMPSDKLRGWHTALADIDNNPADILFIGDSIVEGDDITTRSARWVDLCVQRIRTRWQPAGVDGGAGFIPAWYNTSDITDGFTPSGGTNAQTYGLLRRTKTMTGANTLSITVTCTSFKLYYTKRSGGGTLSVAIDGGAATNVDTSNASIVEPSSWDSGALTDASHSIVIAVVSGTVNVSGIMVFRDDETKGVRGWEAGYSGATAGQISAYTYFGQWVGEIDPDLVVIEVGTNDYANAISPATVKTSIESMITSIRANTSPDASIVLMAIYDRPAVGAAWPSYIAAIDAIAKAQDDVSVFDLAKRIGAAGTTASGGLVSSVHPTALGSRYIANALAGFLEPR